MLGILLKPEVKEKVIKSLGSDFFRNEKCLPFSIKIY